MKLHKKELLLISAVIMLIAAVSILFCLSISQIENDEYQSEICEEYEETVEETDNKEISEALAAANEYNSLLLPVHFDEKATVATKAEYSKLLNINEDGVMGYIEIPKINVNLPIYHGSGTESLNKGIGHLIGSSLPVGGLGTHTVLTGHTGIASKRMFTDLNKMEVGDIFYLRVLSETLVYKVSEIHIVLPYDTSLLSIEKDKDRCTLITCTPKHVNTYRLLVQADRVITDESEQVSQGNETTYVTEAETKNPRVSPITLIVAVLFVFLVILFLICIVSLKKDRSKNKKHDK